MDYEKAYKDARQAAKHALDCAKQGLITTDKVLIERMFPELKESEDEKIRKALIRVLNENVGNGIEKYGAKLEDALAWLEKQGEKKPTEWSEDDERIVAALMEGFRYHQLFNPRFGEVPNAEIISWIKSLKERLS